MTTTGLSSWIYTSFRRTKRRFQGLQRTARYSFEPLDGTSGVSSAKSALLPDVTAAASSPSPRDSLDVDDDVDGAGISNRGGTSDVGVGDDGSRPNSVVDTGVASPVHSTATSAIKYDAMMESEPSSPTTPSAAARNSASSPPSSPPKSPFRKRSSKPFLSLRKKKKSETPPAADKKLSSSSASEEAKSVVGATAGPPSTPSISKRDDDVEMLRQEVTALKMELKKSEENYKRLSQREKILQDRLAAQALHVLEKSGKFDNINSAELRPSQIVTMFQELYSQGRVDAIDALDELEELEDFDDLKTKILYSVIVLAHRSAKRTVDNLHLTVRDSLQLPDTSALTGDDDDDDQVGLLEGNVLSNSLKINDQSSSTRDIRWTSLAKGVEDAVADWLRKTAMAFDLSICLEEVEEQLHATLFDFPSLKDCAPLRDFIRSATRVSWCCAVQNPPFVVEYQHTDFKADCHQRFVTADPENEKISSYVWPGLFDDYNGACLVRGVVIT